MVVGCECGRGVSEAVSTVWEHVWPVRDASSVQAVHSKPAMSLQCSGKARSYSFKVGNREMGSGIMKKKHNIRTTR